MSQTIVNVADDAPISQRSYFNDRYEVFRILSEQAKKLAQHEDYAILHTRALLAAKYLKRASR